MPSTIAHGLAAAALGAAVYPGQRHRLYVAAAVGAVLPDLDAIGRPFGRGDLPWLGGHRALTHSLAFAATLALVAVAVMCCGSSWKGRRFGAWTYFALAFALHGALDAFTTYGEGVMFLAPLSAARFKAPWQPFHGSLPELVGIWIPALMILWYRRHNPRVDSLSPAP